MSVVPMHEGETIHGWTFHHTQKVRRSDGRLIVEPMVTARKQRGLTTFDTIEARGEHGFGETFDPEVLFDRCLFDALRYDCHKARQKGDPAELGAAMVALAQHEAAARVRSGARQVAKGAAAMVIGAPATARSRAERPV